jgi:methylenetetrahydrofolate--tRNA-(uracil-5-)-methyltransferase
MVEAVSVIGGGLAGSEAAWQIAECGLPVDLYEMRPERVTGAHQTDQLAELVCSNSLGSTLPDRANGVLMEELRQLGSMLLQVAEDNAVPAGGALAVAREGFAREVTARIISHPRIRLIRQEVRSIPAGVLIIASGPLTSPALSQALQRLTGEEHLYFYDAISPIVEVDSLDVSVVFRGSRYGRGEMADGDYLNSPLSPTQYAGFVRELRQAERIELREFETQIREGIKAGPAQFFEACLPIEILAERGEQALAFGPLRPVGLVDPRTGQRPHAVAQLRQDDRVGSLYNLVGFQTNLTYPEQRRVFRRLPGLEKARFARYGQMHRNTFVNAPRLLQADLRLAGHAGLFLAGQITGVEGYLGNIATGCLAGRNAARLARGESLLVLPEETMLGALLQYVTTADPSRFQPMKANLGLLPPLTEPGAGGRRGRRERARLLAARASVALADYLLAQGEARPAIAHSHHAV